jgi:hypothetical protein
MELVRYFVAPNEEIFGLYDKAIIGFGYDSNLHMHIVTDTMYKNYLFTAEFSSYSKEELESMSHTHAQITWPFYPVEKHHPLFSGNTDITVF